MFDELSCNLKVFFWQWKILMPDFDYFFGGGGILLSRFLLTKSEQGWSSQNYFKTQTLQEKFVKYQLSFCFFWILII